MFKFNILLFLILFYHALGGSGTYSGDFDFAHGLNIKCEFITNNIVKVFATIEINTSECIGDANIQLALMKKGFLGDQIVVSDSFPNKVGTYYVSLKTEETFNNDQTFYLYMRNWCGFTAKGTIKINYDY